MSKIEVDAIEPQSGTSLTLGASGDTITIPSGATLTNSGTATGFGKVLQVVSATDSTERSTSSASFVTASNTLSVNITPSSTSNRIYINCSFHLQTPTLQNQLRCTIFRDSTNLGDSDMGFGQLKNAADGTGNYLGLASMTILDSPSTTSQITYQLYMKTSSGTGKINANTGLSCLTAFEIEG